VFDFLSQLLALALHDSIFAANIQDVKDIYTKKIPPHRRGMQLKIKRKWLDVPIFREPERTEEGYRTSEEIPLKAATEGRYLKHTGEYAGQEKNLTQKFLQHGGINAINSRMHPPTLSGAIAD
jgi:hypothetical protein